MASALPDPARPRVLLLSHSGGRSGAPRVLLHLGTWLSSTRPDARIGTVVRTPGPLVAEFARLGPVAAPRPLRPTMPGRDALRRVQLAARVPALRRRLGPVDLIWNNTLANGEVLALARRAFPGTPVVTHAHELAEGVRLYTDRRALDRTLSLTDGYLAASEATARFLTGDLGVDPARVRVAHEFVPVAEIAAPPSGTGEPGSDDDDLAELLGHDGPTVVACGVVEWRKGPDLLVDVARRLAAAHPDTGARFVWVGGPRQAAREAEADATAAGLAGRVRFVGERADPRPFLRAADLLLLPSREDCYPLVMLEAAALGIPTVAFADSGGTPEFLAGGHGVTVPYLDTAAMADEVAALLADPARRTAVGEAARRHVLATADVAVGAPHAWRAALELAQHARS